MGDPGGLGADFIVVLGVASGVIKVVARLLKSAKVTYSVEPRERSAC